MFDARVGGRKHVGRSTAGFTWFACAAALWLAAAPAAADQRYSDEVFFDNSLSRDAHHQSAGKTSGASRLALVDGKLPLERTRVISAPNALRLAWTSAPDGGWTAEVRLYQWRNRNLRWAGDALYFWVWSDARIAAADLPSIAFVQADLGNSWLGFDRGHTVPRPLSDFSGDIPTQRWTRIRVPLDGFARNSLVPFDPRRTGTVVFAQGARRDGRAHALVIDDMRIQDGPGRARAPATPTALSARGYERHALLRWTDVDDADIAQYVVYRALDGGAWMQVGVQRPGIGMFSDWIGKPGASARYRVTARTSALAESKPTTDAAARTAPMDDDALLTMVQEASFRHYWDAAEPISGMARESQPGADDMIATGASGFGIMAMLVAVERGFITREQALARMEKILAFLERAERFQGVWLHYIDARTGKPYATFEIYEDGADLVETSFLLQGLLAARGYYTAGDAREARLRERITTLWHAAEWDWFRATPKRDALYWHWSPNYAFQIANRLEGWNEVMITYLLAIASPTHPAPASIYWTGYTRVGGKEPYGVEREYYGIKLDQVYFPPTKDSPGSPGPLFFTHYSYLGYDPRGVRDRFSNYFRSNRAQSLVSQRYAIDNPGKYKGYGADSWGITAVDGPDDQYHEYKPFLTDDGTLAPTGAVSAYAYTPAQSLQAIRHWYRDLGAQLWDVYGFRDSFNEHVDWYSGITMGLNQAPQVVMIENGRTGLVWRAFMANPEIRAMQSKLELRADQDEPR